MRNRDCPQISNFEPDSGPEQDSQASVSQLVGHCNLTEALEASLPLSNMQSNGAADRAAHGVQSGSGPSWREVAAAVVSNLSLFGLDIAAPLSLSWFNEASRIAGVRGLPSADGQQPFALLIGNSKAIWAPFIAACTSHNELLQEANPLDSYVERSVEAVCSDALPGVNPRVYWSHQRTADASDGGYVSLQRAAAVAGFAYQDPVSHLCLHPKYGAWFSLRCLLVFDGIQYPGPKPALLRNPHTSTTTQYVRMAVNSAMRGSSCDLDRLAKQAKAGETPSPEAVRQQWHKWVAVRDAHCAGHPWRYSKHQLAYHYTQDKRILRRLVAAASCPRFAPQRLAVELELPEATLRREARRCSFDGQPLTPSPVAAERRRLASSKSMGAGGIPIPWPTTGGGGGGSPVSPFAAAAAAEEEDGKFAAALDADLLRVASAPVGAPVQKRAQDEARCEAMLARVDSMSGESSDGTSELSDSTATAAFDDHARTSGRVDSLQKPLDLLVLQH